MAPTAASRPGGKFASLSNKPRGKFANTNTTTTDNPTSDGTGINKDGILSSTSPNPNTTGEPNNANDQSRFKYYNERHNSTKSTLTSKRSRLKTHSVFDDLDEAERLVLDLLSLSSSTADSLSQLAQPAPPPPLPSTSQQAPPQNQLVMQNNHDRNNRNFREMNGVLTERIRSNGKEYVSKLGRIYSLLEPRAHLVVSYGNLPPPSSSSSASANATVAVKNEKLPLAPHSNNNNGSNKKDGDAKDNHNMYASRLEMRLAIERRDLMKELVRLEKQDILCDDNIHATAKAADSVNDINSEDTTTTITTTTPMITPVVDPQQSDSSLTTTATTTTKRKRELDDEKT